jgi:hypothetical protein
MTVPGCTGMAQHLPMHGVQGVLDSWPHWDGQHSETLRKHVGTLSLDGGKKVTEVSTMLRNGDIRIKAL